MTNVEKELTIRLAWYVHRHGPIPEPELRRLWLAATVGCKDTETERIIALADEIRVHFSNV